MVPRRWRRLVDELAFVLVQTVTTDMNNPRFRGRGTTWAGLRGLCARWTDTHIGVSIVVPKKYDAELRRYGRRRARVHFDRLPEPEWARQRAGGSL